MKTKIIAVGGAIVAGMFAVGSVIPAIVILALVAGYAKVA